ncbi:MAG: DUF4179 domain-containing protein [Oscillospiraceae bacterium]|nr:DUF4179 domain-containing protein [Oscillospiraceae bacterium]
MSVNSIVDSIGRIDDDMVECVEKLRKKPRRRRIKMRWIAAVLCLTLLVVSVEASSGLVSNLLAPVYGSAQTELVNDIGIPVDASATVGGYMLTADAIIGDRYNIVIVYTLSREDGEPLPDNIGFRDYKNSVTTGSFSSGGGSIRFQRSEDGSKLQIIEKWTSAYRVLLFRNATAKFTDLICDDNENEELLMEGVWELNFTVRYKDATVKLPVDELDVIGSEGYQYQIQKILLSPLGIHMNLIAPNTINEDPYSKLMPDFQVSVVLKDGTVIKMVDGNRGGGGDVGSAALKAHYGVMFKEPIPLDTISALLICDTTLDVNLS